MTLSSRIESVVVAIGADIKGLRSRLDSAEAAGHLYVQDAPPSAPGAYLWVQTNFQATGGIALWVEDGKP